MKMKINICLLLGVIFFGIIGMYYGIILDESELHPSENRTNLPIHISSEDFEKGIAFTDLNSIDEVSQKDVIIVSGILEYDE